MKPTLSSVPIFLLLSLARLLDVDAATVTYPPTVGVGLSQAQYISTSDPGFDSPKVFPLVNSTTYNWWYFDAISLDLNDTYSLSATFFVSPNTAFPFTLSSAQTLEVFITVQTPESDSFFANAAFATSADLTSVGDGTSGVWEGTGFSFNGSEDLSSYEVNFDSDALGIQGSMNMQSIAPAHYPCSPAQAGSNMEVLPNLGWANAIPDSQATVQLEVNGKNVSFTGSGYHDMNWGDKAFTDAVSTFYWGHGRLGPYSLVWLDTSANDGSRHTSGYVSMDGSILGTLCSGVQVNTTQSASGSGFDVAITVDLGGDGVLEAQFATEHQLISAVGVFSRWTGRLSGGILGSDGQYSGTAMFDEFDFRH